MVLLKLPKLPSISGKIPYRINIAIMMFMACLTSYMMRVNLSINILAMVNPKHMENSTEPPPNHGPRYNWSTHDQSTLLGSYFYGYLLTSLPGGMLAERFGGTAVIGYTLAMSSALTALTPIAASLHLWAAIVIRFLTGFLGGVLYPAQHSLISKWAPPDEKGKFVSALMGGTFGTVITWPISGLIVEEMNWPWAFYISAIFSIFIVFLWFLIVADSPADHKRLKKEEREYIESSLGEALSKKKSWPPFRYLFTSLPFWSLVVLHYGSMWGMSFLITAAPKFMSEVLGFKVAKAGILSSLPYLARMILAFIFGAIGDFIRRRNLLSVTKIRKSFCLFSHVIPGILLIILAYFGRDPYVCVAIITLSLGFNGAATITNLQNAQDLAPNYAGTVYGMINVIGTTPGFFAPMLVAYFTAEKNTIHEWLYVFLVGAGAYIIPAIVFTIFGSGTVQKWNDFKKNNGDTEDNPNVENNTKF